MEPEIIGRKYDKIADWWNATHQNSSYGIPQIERAIFYCKNRHVALDVGCGSGGRIINKLKENGFKIKGVDISEKMLQFARMQHPDISFVRSDIRNWGEDEKYDLIIAWDSIFHLAKVDQEPVIKKLCGLLQINGILIYTFGDDYGDHEDLSFQDNSGKQYGELNNDKFGYGTIGINDNLRVLMDSGCKCMHLEIDQYPANHVYVIAEKI